MNISIQDRHQIDRYLQGDLSGIELENFNQRLVADNFLKREVELQELLYKGIRLAEQKELRSRILLSIGYSKPRIPFALKMIILFLIVMGAGISFWQYIGNESAQREQEKSWVAFLRNKSPQTEHPPAEKKEGKPIHTQDVLLSVSVQPAESKAAEVNEPDSIERLTNAIVPDSSGGENAGDIVVKQDQLLISTLLPAQEMSQDSTEEKEVSMASETADKLNPAADLPEEEKPVTAYQVEFWVSPINYRGYKLSKNKLILFGIDAPDAVRLYRVNDTLYMLYLNDYYRLSNSLEFLSYHKLKEAEIPMAIK